MSGTADSISIRPFEPADGPFCHRLRREAFLRVFSRDLGPDAVRACADAFGEREFSGLIGDLDTFVAVEGTEPRGFTTIRYPEKGKAEILYAYVHLAHLKEGIGSRLVRHAEHWIRERHPEVATIMLDTAVPRYNKAFYERLGYVEEGRTACRYPAGEVEAVHLVKHLGPPRKGAKE